MGMTRTLIILVSCLLAFSAAGDLVIELKDGRRIQLPVDASEIDSISFERKEQKGDTKRKARDDGRSSDARVDVQKAAAGPEASRVLRVGPTRELRRPSDAARAARLGDTIEIDAGVYANDYAVWKQSNITLRGVGGMAHLKSKGLIPNRKAIWIIKGDNVTIENVEFSGASVKDTNGAGIRHEGARLTLRNTFFHDNEFSILTGRLPRAEIDISASRFWDQKRPKRHSHGIYIGDVRSLTFVGNHVTGTDKGHQVKSRARKNLIAYNRIEDRPGGNSSRLLDLSECGFSVVVGNQLHQGHSSANYNVIGYGPEGCKGRTERQMKLFVVSNTFINEAPGGELVRNFAGGEVVVRNNLVYGAGRLLHGAGEAEDNLRLPLDRLPKERWSAPSVAEAIDQAADLSDIDDGALVPTSEFVPPAGTRDRPVSGPLDIGAREHAPEP